MIGVVADSSEHEVVREFFQLFKTPWEFYQQGRHYEIVLCCGNHHVEECAKLVLLYSGRKTDSDDQTEGEVRGERHESSILLYKGQRIPIYGDFITFAGTKGRVLLREENSRQSVAISYRSRQKIKQLPPKRIAAIASAKRASPCMAIQPIRGAPPNIVKTPRFLQPPYL